MLLDVGLQLLTRFCLELQKAWCGAGSLGKFMNVCFGRFSSSPRLETTLQTVPNVGAGKAPQNSLDVS